jgi:hypothetical protein
MEPGGEGELSPVFRLREYATATAVGAVEIAVCGMVSGAAGTYLLVALRVLPSIWGAFVQQVWSSDICEPPHWPLIFRQQSSSASVIASPGRAQAARGRDSNKSAKLKQTNLQMRVTDIV